MKKQKRYDSQDPRFTLLRKTFFNHLQKRNNLYIPREDAEDIIEALWIFVNKRMADILEVNNQAINKKSAEELWTFIQENNIAKQYFYNLLKSYTTYSQIKTLKITPSPYLTE
ncbi:hypothetical protein ACW6QP_05330 [Salegentibacter sp. HM20]